MRYETRKDKRNKHDRMVARASRLRAIETVRIENEWTKHHTNMLIKLMHRQISKHTKVDCLDMSLILNHQMAKKYVLKFLIFR